MSIFIFGNVGRFYRYHQYYIDGDNTIKSIVKRFSRTAGNKIIVFNDFKYRAFYYIYIYEIDRKKNRYIGFCHWSKYLFKDGDIVFLRNIFNRAAEYLLNFYDYRTETKFYKNKKLCKRLKNIEEQILEKKDVVTSDKVPHEDIAYKGLYYGREMSNKEGYEILNRISNDIIDTIKNTEYTIIDVRDFDDDDEYAAMSRPSSEKGSRKKSVKRKSSNTAKKKESRSLLIFRRLVSVFSDIRIKHININLTWLFRIMCGVLICLLAFIFVRWIIHRKSQPMPLTVTPTEEVRKPSNVVKAEKSVKGDTENSLIKETIDKEHGIDEYVTEAEKMSLSDDKLNAYKKIVREYAEVREVYRQEKRKDLEDKLQPKIVEVVAIRDSIDRKIKSYKKEKETKPYQNKTQKTENTKRDTFLEAKNRGDTYMQNDVDQKFNSLVSEADKFFRKYYDGDESAARHAIEIYDKALRIKYNSMVSKRREMLKQEIE